MVFYVLYCEKEKEILSFGPEKSSALSGGYFKGELVS